MNPHLQDPIRVEFLFALDAADFEVSPWEADFLESFKRRPDALTAAFSEKQRHSIDQMIKSYLHRLPPSAVALPPSKPAIPPPAPIGQCNYLIREPNGPLARCGQPAAGEFCPECQQTRAAAKKRAA